MGMFNANAAKKEEDANTVTTGSFADINFSFDGSTGFGNAHETKEQVTEEKVEKIVAKETTDEDNGNYTLSAIVSLEEQKVDNGHEDETLINTFKFTKLYRFGKDVSGMPVWKNRASKSTVSFYKSKSNGKIRIVSRENITNKLRMNQFVPKADVAAFQLKQQRAYSWNAYDASIAMEEEDEDKGFCAWTIKFETQEIAEAFAAEFKNAISCNSSIASPVKAAKPKVIAPSTPDVVVQQEEEKKVEQPDEEQKVDSGH